MGFAPLKEKFPLPLDKGKGIGLPNKKFKKARYVGNFQRY
jgi:hypothetical protein